MFVYVLVLTGFFNGASVPKVDAGSFESEKACLEAQATVQKAVAAEPSPELKTFGSKCIKIEVKPVPKVQAKL